MVIYGERHLLSNTTGISKRPCVSRGNSPSTAGRCGVGVQLAMETKCHYIVLTKRCPGDTIMVR